MRDLLATLVLASLISVSSSSLLGCVGSASTPAQGGSADSSVDASPAGADAAEPRVEAGAVVPGGDGTVTPGGDGAAAPGVEPGGMTPAPDAGADVTH